MVYQIEKARRDVGDGENKSMSLSPDQSVGAYVAVYDGNEVGSGMCSAYASPVNGHDRIGRFSQPGHGHFRKGNNRIRAEVQEAARS